MHGKSDEVSRTGARLGAEKPNKTAKKEAVWRHGTQVCLRKDDQTPGQTCIETLEIMGGVAIHNVLCP